MLVMVEKVWRRNTTLSKHLILTQEAERELKVELG